MMDFEVIEDQIVSHLSKNMKKDDKIIIEVLGEHDGDYDLPFGKKKIIIAFSNEEPDPMSNSFDIVNQPTMVVFSILMQSKTRRGENGIYQLAAGIKLHLTGYQPKDGESFKYAGMRFEQKIKDVFEYSMDFKTKSMVVQKTYEEEGPKFKNSTYTQ